MNKNRILISEIKNFSGINTFYLNVALVLIGCLLLAISAKVQVPFWPVPMTMQTFIVFIIGMLYGAKLAFFTLIFYLIEGALGLPVFAKGGGLLYLTGPTAGYLYGMTVAAGVIGYFAERGYNESYFKSFISLIVGTFSDKVVFNALVGNPPVHIPATVLTPVTVILSPSEATTIYGTNNMLGAIEIRTR